MPRLFIHFFSAVVPRSFSRYFHMIDDLLADLRILIIFILLGICAYLSKFKYVFHEIRQQDNQFRITSFYLLGALWVLADLFAALAGNRPQNHYFLPLTLSIAAMVGLTYSLQVEAIGSGKRVQCLILTLLLAPLVLTHFYKEFRELIHLVRYGHTLSHDRDLGHDKPPLEEQAKQIAVFIEGVRKKDDTLFSWEMIPWIFNAVNIKSPIFALDMSYRKAFSGSLRQRFVEDVMRQLQSHPPTFIMDSTNDPELTKRQDSLYKEFARFVDDQYECLKEFKLSWKLSYDIIIVRVYKRTGKGEAMGKSWQSSQSGTSNLECVDHSGGLADIR